MKYKEDNLQIAVMDYIRLQYPTALAIHVGNERATSPQAGARLKRKGVLSGVFDILIFNPIDKFNGLAIELKIKPNKPTENQLDFKHKIEYNCWKAEIIYDFNNAKNAIDSYFNQ